MRRIVELTLFCSRVEEMQNFRLSPSSSLVPVGTFEWVQRLW
jgi:hypothetical protein